VLKNGRDLGITHLEYAYQEAEGGIAQALALCEDFADGESIAVILGDNTTDADIGPAVRSFNSGARIFLQTVPDPERFGVPVFDNAGHITSIEEKPANPQSNYAVTGLYIYDNRVFEYVRQCRPSHRGELEITDVNNMYIESGELDWVELKGFWSDAGTFESLYRTNRFWAEKGLEGSENG
jgi:glucose-1-phosphate thymidylyltransferase